MRGYRTHRIGRLQNGMKHGIEVGHDICIAKAEHQIPHRLQMLRSFGIAFDAGGGVMARTVDFDDQVMLRTCEVRNIAVDCELTLELQSVPLAIAQCQP